MIHLERFTKEIETYAGMSKAELRLKRTEARAIVLAQANEWRETHRDVTILGISETSLYDSPYWERITVIYER